MLVEESGKDTGDVAIDNGGGPVKGKAADSAGGVASDAGE